MRYLKILGLAALAVTALVAILGSGTASAAVYCTVPITPCPAKSDEPAGTHIEASLQGSAVVATTAGMEVDTCTTGSKKWEMENTGGLATPLFMRREEVTFGNCTSAIKTLKLGTTKVEHIAGTENGTVFDEGTEFTAVFLGADCSYKTGSATHIGTIKGGSETIMETNAVLGKSAGSLLCPTTLRWTAVFIITKPAGLSVEAF